MSSNDWASIWTNERRSKSKMQTFFVFVSPPFRNIFQKKTKENNAKRLFFIIDARNIDEKLLRAELSSNDFRVHRWFLPKLEILHSILKTKERIGFILFSRENIMNFAMSQHVLLDVGRRNQRLNRFARHVRILRLFHFITSNGRMNVTVDSTMNDIAVGHRFFAERRFERVAAEDDGTGTYFYSAKYILPDGFVPYSVSEEFGVECSWQRFLCRRFVVDSWFRILFLGT